MQNCLWQMHRPLEVYIERQPPPPPLFWILQDNVCGCSFSGRSQNVYTWKKIDYMVAMSKSSHYWHTWSVCQCSFCVCRLYRYNCEENPVAADVGYWPYCEYVSTMQLITVRALLCCTFPWTVTRALFLRCVVHTRGRLIPVGKLGGLLGRKIFWQNIRKQ